MADNVVVTAGSGTTVAADEVVDGVLGTVKVQYVKLMDGTIDGTTKAGVGANGLKVSSFIDPASVNANGQATMANSAPVVIASNQSNLPVNLAQVAGVATPVGSGVQATAPRMTLAT